MMKILKNVILSVMIAVCVWGTVSYIDIVADNCKENPSTSPYNFFVVVDSIRG